jgi:hypothetical protein
MRPNRCDCCGDKFGLVSHSFWNRRFCCKPCRNAYQAKNSRLHRLAVRLADNAGHSFEWLKSTVQDRGLASQAGNAGS